MDNFQSPTITKGLLEIKKSIKGILISLFLGLVIGGTFISVSESEYELKAIINNGKIVKANDSGDIILAPIVTMSDLKSFIQLEYIFPNIKVNNAYIKSIETPRGQDTQNLLITFRGPSTEVLTLFFDNFLKALNDKFSQELKMSYQALQDMKEAYSDKSVTIKQFDDKQTYTFGLIKFLKYREASILQDEAKLRYFLRKDNFENIKVLSKSFKKDPVYPNKILSLIIPPVILIFVYINFILLRLIFSNLDE